MSAANQASNPRKGSAFVSEPANDYRECTHTHKLRNPCPLDAVIAWCAKHEVVEPRIEEWRMVPTKEQRMGEINALTHSRGIPRITNGIMCWIEREDGTLYRGHWAWFVHDATEPQATRLSGTKATITKNRKVSALQRFMLELENA